MLWRHNAIDNTFSQRKHTFRIIVAITLLLVCLLVLNIIANFKQYSSAASELNFVIKIGNTTQTISTWYDEDTKISYLFLPSFSRFDDIKVVCAENSAVQIGDYRYADGDGLNQYNLKQEYGISASDNSGNISMHGKMVFMKSENIPAMMIQTESGGMDYLNTAKENKEAAEMILTQSDGRIDYNGSLEYVEGRGHLSRNDPKKPLNIKLSAEKSLLGMGTAEKWCLLANYYEKSSIRDKIVFDFAKNIGFSYSPDSQFVDLYINGAYAGLYLLAEKVELGASRINISNLELQTQLMNTQKLKRYLPYLTATAKGYLIESNPADISSGYLLELDHSGSSTDAPSWIITAHNQGFAVKSPEYASLEQINFIQRYFDEFEEALYSDTGRNSAGRAYSDYINMRSWAIKYLLDEVFTNQDAEWSSQFFYIISNRGVPKIYAGPPWDYDSAIGNIDNSPKIYSNIIGANPRALIALWRGEYDPQHRSWYAEILKKAEFKDLVSALYKDLFKPFLDRLLKTEISGYVDRIAGSALMNQMRWYPEGSVQAAFSAFRNTEDSLTQFLSERTGFLDTYFSGSGYDYKVAFNGLQKNIYYNYLITNGQKVEAPTPPVIDDYIFAGWYYADTDIPYDPTIPITKNTELYAKWKAKSPLVLFIKENLTLIITLGALIVVIVLYFIDKKLSSRGVLLKSTL